MEYFIPSTQRSIILYAAQDESKPVLILGASGTGKGSLAEWIHQNGPDATKPFIRMDQTRPLWEQLAFAKEGSFYIPEVGTLPLSEQNILLNYLRNHTVKRPEPGVAEIPLDVRILAASTQLLKNRVQGGLFNIELYENLNFYEILMPVLSDRRDEFPSIAHTMMSEIVRDLQKEHLNGIAEDAMEILRAYDWPGNLRELRNVLKYSILKAGGAQVEKGDLPEFGHDALSFRAGREQFERIYLGELLRTFEGDLDRIAKATRVDIEALKAKLARLGL